MEREDAKALLETKVSEALDSVSTSTDAADSAEPPEKRAKTDIMKVFDEIIEEADTSAAGTGTTISLVDTYLPEPLLPYHSGNAYTWWKENGFRFKPISCLALRYLSAPPTSVPSERLFSTAGDIYDEKRNRLTPERAETLLFIKSNFHLLL